MQPFEVFRVIVITMNNKMLNRISVVILFLLAGVLGYAKASSVDGSDSLEHIANTEVKRNAIRIDVFGKAYYGGIAYDRIIHTGKTFNLHANLGFLPTSLFPGTIKYLNAALYFSSERYVIDPVFGIASSLYYYNNKYQWYRYSELFFGLHLGVKYDIGKNWDVHFYYNPFYVQLRSEQYWEGSEVLEHNPLKNSDFAFLWGGLSLGRKF